jgi:hypothetical protein
VATQWIGANAGNFAIGRCGAFRPEAIVIHIMDGSLAGTDSWFNDPAARVSAHYGVGRSGLVHQYVKETDTAFHAGTVDPLDAPDAGGVERPVWNLLKPNVNPNYYTIGVEHEGLGDEPYPWPDDQLKASLALVAAIASRWIIPLDADHVIPHHWIRKSKTCPGGNFDQVDYVRRLARLAAPAPLAVTAIAATMVRALTRVRVRTQPTSASAILRVLSQGDAFLATGVVDAGELVAGNSIWFSDGAGGFLWAGATDRPQGV